MSNLPVGQSVFACPICRQMMKRDSVSYRCMSGHSFDIAKEGYVNLLPANQKHSDMPGDDREMVRARTLFLNGGWYAPLRESLCRLTEMYLGQYPTVLDVGCGEGYYTEALTQIAEAGNGRTAGVDLSRFAVRKAAKRCDGAEIAVASVYHLPLKDESVSLLVNCFSPLAAGEFHRVLKPGGYFLYVVPGQKHLWEMKEILYDQPYENELRNEAYEGFSQIEEKSLQFRFHLQKQEEITALFQMTPYAWKTPKEGKDRLAECRELKLTAAFRILIFQKTESALWTEPEEARSVI